MPDETRDALHGLEGFTPGPWRATEPNGFGACHIRAGAMPPAPIAEVLHFDGNGSEANARLIARAPALVDEIRELRRSLRECVAEIEAWGGGHERVSQGILARARSLLPDTGDER